MFFSSKFYYDENRIKMIIKNVKKFLIFKNFSYNLIYLELFLRDVHKNINRAFKIAFIGFLSVYCFLYFMVLSHLVRSYKRLAPHTYLRSGY